MTAPAVGRAVRAAGDESVRLDRLLTVVSLFETRGRYRGKKYGLTDAGVKYCEELILDELTKEERNGLEAEG